nr:probable membrane-associated kinase regulator 4 [Ipomoea batatas]
MEVNSSSSPQIREFEFQMASISVEKGPSTSPADELFYRGKLLPLHLPPRLQMVQKLLQNTTTTIDEEEEEESFCGMPFISTATSSTDTSTPMESCNISPSESCRVSCELNPDDCYFEWSSEFSTFINSHPKKSWAKKLKLVKQSLISQKLKASKAYLKGLFSKSGCSDESCAKAASCCNHPESDQQQGLNGQDFSINNKYMKVGMRPSLPYIGKCPHPTIASVIKNGERDGVEDTLSNPRRSFSAAIKRHSPTKCLSSSSSFSSGTSSSSSSSSIAFISNGCYELNFLKRSSSDTSEIEGSIQAAIAHCKKSQELSSSRKPLAENGACSLSAPKIVACDVQGRQETGKEDKVEKIGYETTYSNPVVEIAGHVRDELCGFVWVLLALLLIPFSTKLET